MADTGEDRELKQRVNAHQAELVRESKKLVQKTKQPSNKKAGEPSRRRSKAKS